MKTLKKKFIKELKEFKPVQIQHYNLYYQILVKVSSSNWYYRRHLFLKKNKKLIKSAFLNLEF